MNIEKCIVGLCMQNYTAIIDFNALGITDDDFTDNDIKKAWRAITDLHKANVEVNLVTLHEKEPGIVSLLMDCATDTPIVNSPSWYGERLVKASWVRKTALELSALTQRLLTETDYDLCKNEVEKSFERVNKNKFNSKKLTRHIADVLSDYSDQLEKRIVDSIEGKTRGITSGIKALDELIHGWMPSSVNVVAARTSMGKTTLALNFVNVAINAGHKALFFTNEMPSVQIAEKILSLRSGIFNHKLFSGKLDEGQINRVVGSCSVLSSKDLFVNERSGRKVESFLNEVRQANRLHGVNLVVMDYLQQMSTSNGSSGQNRNQELAEISGAIKDLALELDVSFICLAQCNRQAENSNDPPSLSNIRDSGAIEQDADTVIFIHRERERIDGQCDLVVAKNRFGPTGKVQVQTDLKINKFF